MIDPLFSLDGKVIVVTGGLGQLGMAYSQAILARGGNVVIVDRDYDGTIPDVFDKYQDNVLLLKADVTNHQSLCGALEEVESRWGIPHGLVNNAALDSPPGASSLEEWSF